MYYIDFRDRRGRRVRELAGTTRTQARNLLTRRLGEVRARTFVHPKDLEDERGPTFDEFADRFMRVYAVRCRSDHYKDRVKRLRPCLGGRRLRQICRADLDLFVAERGLKVGPSTLRKDIAALLRGVTGRDQSARLLRGFNDDDGAT